MAKRITILILAFVLVAATIFTGCAPARRPYTGQNTNQYGTRQSYTGLNGGRTGMGTGTGYGTTGAGVGTNYDKGTGYYGTGYGPGTGYGTTGYGTTGYGTTGTGTGYGTNVGYYGGTGAGTGTGMGTGYGTTGTGTTTDTRKTAEMARAIEQIQGVQRAMVVVTGNTAYVGLKLNNTARTGNRNINREAAQMVRSLGNNINTVYVSTDANFMNRLRNVSSGITSGRTVNTFTNELNQMVQRITPTRF